MPDNQGLQPEAFKETGFWENMVPWRQHAIQERSRKAQFMQLIGKQKRQRKQQEFNNTLAKMNVNSDVMLNRNLSKGTRFGAWKAYRAEHNKLMSGQPLPALTQEQYFAQENTVTKGIKQVSNLYSEAQKDPRAMKTLLREYPRIISESLGAGAKTATLAPLTEAIGGLQQQTQRGAQAEALMGLMGKPQVGPPTPQQQAAGGFIRAGGRPGDLRGFMPRAPQPTRGIPVSPGTGVIDPVTGRSIYQQPTKLSPTIQAEKLRQQRVKGKAALPKEERIRQRLIKLTTQQRINYFQRTQKMSREDAEKENVMFEIENDVGGKAALPGVIPAHTRPELQQGQLPPGISEEMLQSTMKLHQMTRQQVLDAYKAKQGR